jgi:hypothetical protein
MQNQKQYWEADYKWNNGLCKVCNKNEYGADTYNNICNECREAIRRRKELTEAKQRVWEEQHPILNSLKMLLVFIPIGLIGYGVVSSFNEKPLSNEHYEDTGKYFNGDPCMGDCSGHEAGFEWAKNNRIEYVSDCSGNSESFIEGCESWVENSPNSVWDTKE